MKLRTTHNSIRIRIRKSELTTLEKENRVGESIRFPDGTLFRFALEVNQQEEIVSSSLNDNQLILSISPQEAKKWISTNQVGIETNINLPDEEKLHLLIEKDFPCLDREEEDKSDTFWELAPDSPDAC